MKESCKPVAVLESGGGQSKTDWETEMKRIRTDAVEVWLEAVARSFLRKRNETNHGKDAFLPSTDTNFSGYGYPQNE